MIKQLEKFPRYIQLANRDLTFNEKRRRWEMVNAGGDLVGVGSFRDLFQSLDPAKNPAHEVVFHGKLVAFVWKRRKDSMCAYFPASKYYVSYASAEELLEATLKDAEYRAGRDAAKAQNARPKEDVQKPLLPVTPEMEAVAKKAAVMYSFRGYDRCLDCLRQGGRLFTQDGQGHYLPTGRYGMTHVENMSLEHLENALACAGKPGFSLITRYLRSHPVEDAVLARIAKLRTEQEASVQQLAESVMDLIDGIPVGAWTVSFQTQTAMKIKQICNHVLKGEKR